MTATYAGLAVLSAAALAFEITLTRLFSVTQWYHFAFLAVSVGLLGYGASGTVLSLVPRWARPPTHRRACVWSLLFALSVVSAYLSLNYLPFDSFRIAWERVQVLYLALYYLALTLPFLCAGLVTALLLTALPEHASRLYASNLAGSALGGLVPALLLPPLGEGTVLAIAAMGIVAALVFRFPESRAWQQTADPCARIPAAKTRLINLLLLVSFLLVALLSWRLPALFSLRLSPYKGLSQVLRFPDAKVVWQRWNAFSRVDLVESSAIRSAPGLSLNYTGELPAEDGLFVDGDDLSPVIAGGGVWQGTSVGTTAPDRSTLQAFTGDLPVALPYKMRPGGQVLVLEPRGGLDIWVALSQGAGSVVAVESNALLVEAAGWVYRDPRVRVEVEDGRSYVRRSTETFDVIHLALTDSYRPVTTGAFSLSERYDLTVEAFRDYLSRLKPGGLLVVERWLQLPPSEELRAAATAVEALRRMGSTDPAARLAALRSWQIGLILIKNGPLTEAELDQIRSFARIQGLDLVALPGLTESETNRFNILQEPVYFRLFGQLLSDPEALYASSPYDVRPPTDDRPFFFHFFRWGQARTVLGQLGKTWQPWGGSGYFVLVALLVLAVVLSTIMMVLPLVLIRRRSAPVLAMKGAKTRTLLYFGLVGLGFLFVEMPLMQRFILLLGQPIYAFTAVLVSLLFFSGLGSLLSARLPYRHAAIALVLAILAYPPGLSYLFRALLGMPLGIRLLAAGLSLAPLGFLMGVPFPRGLAWLHERAPHLVPWAWAVNGFLSVLASIVATMIALSAGFSWVFGAAALAYAGAAAVLGTGPSQAHTPQAEAG